MVVWWSVFAVMMVISGLGMLTYKSDNSVISVDNSSFESYKTINLFFSFLSFALLAFFVGQRSMIFDTQEYIYSYNNNPSEISYAFDLLYGKVEIKGPGYFFILTIFKCLTGGSYNDWFLFIAIIQCASLALFFSRFSINYLLTIYLFITSSCFLWLVNGMRQFLTVCIVLLFIDWIYKKKTIKFIILIVLLYTIHSSALFWIPVYFIIQFSPWSKKFMISLVALMALLLVMSKTSIFNDSDYAYITSSEFAGVNPLRVIVFSIPSILAFIRRKKYEFIDINEYGLFINLSCVCAGCFLVGMFSNGFVARLGVYFQVFGYVLLPWIFRCLYKQEKFIVLFCVLGFLLYFLYDMYVANNGIYYSEVLHLSYWR